VPVIETSDLTVYYGTHRGIVDLNLVVEQGEVFGFLGPNGAGKTTTQRVLLDIIRPSRGSATVFGLDSRKASADIRARTGYLPGELSLYGGMTGRRFLAFMASLEKRAVDPAYVDLLCERLDLDPSRRIRQYSRGNKQKIGVISALMARPDLVVLDEPTTGLDPLVQQTVMELVKEIRNDGRTVFFSSHVLAEVQAVCDRVGIIRDGILVKVESVETLMRQQFRRLRIQFRESPPAEAFQLDGVTRSDDDGTTVTLEVRSNLEEVMRRASSWGIVDLETKPVTLEEVFLAYYGRTGSGAHGGVE
jgi:ABC-2 type transport system ATP-binding protein